MRQKINQEIKNIFTEDYPAWLASRKEYAPSIPVGILAALQPRRNGVDRDYANSPICAFLNAAISLNAQLDRDAFILFTMVYYKKSATYYYKSIGAENVNVKGMAQSLGRTTQYAYELAHVFAIKCYSEAVTALNCNDRLQSMHK